MPTEALAPVSAHERHDTVVASTRIDRHDLQPVGDELAKDPGADAAESTRHEEALGHDAALTDLARSRMRKSVDKDRMFVSK